MSTFQKIAAAIAILIAVALAAAIEHYLPSTVVAQVTGIDVKRMDKRKTGEDGVADTRDVRFIIAKEIDGGEDLVFRNEDTGWGWPPYFKFDSGDVAAQAVNIKETASDSAVLIRYYGWRMPVFDMYPNAVSIRVVDSDYTHVPVFNIVFLILLASAVGFVAFRISRRDRD